MTDTPRVTGAERREALAIARFVEESKGADEVPQWDMVEYDTPIRSDHCICWDLGATGYGQKHTVCPADHFRLPERPETDS